ncbi:beta-aspartyl-peptidase [Microbulbifer hydrolyticus]|uniref:Isoaspartyl dipeptidase n=1 Tax=Microbulbifer hydrolyticus TaxID=48074 RepID=A0A6P1T9I4_9GAMM|nr:beta-aspartyl-peptidase [Microbulbifer hydrolyticus]MBB5210039.1 beta-aspartyl-dipeptidase (metallo-type) [Microbulbifer hydrolyticus]QHQ39438.1 beta-aspartyl-peptidase [Microbulbifer hydrolyticus]
MSQITLIKNAEVFAPRSLGRCDVLVAGNAIAQIDQHLTLPENIGQVVDADGAWLMPGLVDSLVHISGGGGEAGFGSRTPELDVREAISAGVTTVIGALGTDATTRTLNELFGKAKALEAQGISCFIQTGSYQVPVNTLTGSVRSDIMLVENMIGVGELAISDHRSSHPSRDELIRIAADARVAGLLSGKGGVVSIHVGDGAGRLQPLFDVVEHSEIPITQFLPTHMNRNMALLEHGVDFARAGGFIDFTTSTTAEILASGEMRASRALKLALERKAPIDQLTFSSDAQGSLTNFCNQGELQDIEVGSIASLFEEFRRAVQEEGVELASALQVVTSNPARALGLKRKGLVASGRDADLILVDPARFQITHTMARGRWQLFDRQPYGGRETG